MSVPQIPEAHGSLFAAKGKLGDLSRRATLNDSAKALNYAIERITDLKRLVGNETQLGIPRKPRPLPDWAAETAEASAGYLSGITSYFGYGGSQNFAREAQQEACEQAEVAASYYDRLKSCFETFNTITIAFTKDIPYLKNAEKNQSIHHKQLQKMADDVLHEYDKLQKALKDELKDNDPQLYAEFVEASGVDFENEREIFYKKITEYLKKAKNDNIDLKQKLSALQEQLRRAGQDIEFYKRELDNEKLERSKNASLADSADLTMQDVQGRLTVAKRQLKHLQNVNMDLNKKLESVESEKNQALEEGGVLTAQLNSMAEVVKQQADQLRTRGDYASRYQQVRSELDSEHQQLEQARLENESLRHSSLSKTHQLEERLDRYKRSYNALKAEKANAETAIQQLREQAKAETLKVKQLEVESAEQQEKLQSLQRELKISQISESVQKSTGDKAWKDKFKAEKELDELKKSLETRQAELKTSKDDNSILQSELREKLDLLTKYEKEKTRLSEQMAEFGAAKSQLKRTEQELESTRQQVNQLVKNLNDSAKQLSGLEGMRSQHAMMRSELSSAEEREKKLKSDLLSKKMEMQSLQTELAQLKDEQAQLPEKDALEKKVTQATQAMNKAKQDKQQYLTEMMKLKNELADARSKVTYSESQFEKQSVTLAALETSQRELTTDIKKKNSMIRRQAELIGATEKELASLKRQSEELEVTLQQKQERLNELEQVEQERACLIQNIEAMKAELSQQKQDNEALSSKLSRAEASLKVRDSNADEFDTERSRLFDEINELNQEAADLRQAARSAEALQKQLDTAKNELVQKQDELKAQTKEKLNIQKELQESQKKKDEAWSLVKELEKGLIKVQGELQVRESERTAALNQQQDMIEKLHRAEGTESELKKKVATLKDQLDQQIEDNALLRTEIEELKPQAFETTPALASLSPMVNRDIENAGLHQKIQQLEDDLKALRLENDQLRVTMMEPRDVHPVPDYSQLFSLEPGSMVPYTGESSLYSMNFREEGAPLSMVSEETLTSMPYASMSSLPASSGPTSMLNTGVETSQSGKGRDFENRLLLKRVRTAESEQLKLQQALEQSKDNFAQFKEEKRAELNRLKSEKESMDVRLQALESDQDAREYLQADLQKEKQKVLQLEHQLADQEKRMDKELCSVEAARDDEKRGRMDAELKLMRYQQDMQTDLGKAQNDIVALSRQQQQLMETQGAFVQALYDKLGESAHGIIHELVKQHYGDWQQKANEGELTSLRLDSITD